MSETRSDLAAFQAAFAWAILDGRQAGRLAAQPGFAVYRNTSLKAAIETLGANYPTVEALLGTETFGGIALDYAHEHRPASPIMCDYDAAFPDFLAESRLADDLPYLADVARIDWLWAEALFAADAEPITPAALASINESRLAFVGLIPASRHAWFDTPAVTIWSAHRHEPFEQLDVAWRGEGVHLTRTEGTVRVDLVAPEEIALLDALAAGESLIAAAGTLLSRHPDADLQRLVARLAARGAFTFGAQTERSKDRY